MIHAYSGSAEMIPTWTRLGGYLSFGCSLTRPGNHRGHKAARATPADRLLLETDSPDIPPDPNFTVPGLPPLEKGAPNEPCHLPLALHALANARETDPEVLTEQLLFNTRTFFQLP
jgi:TatD DNase family protein